SDALSRRVPHRCSGGGAFALHRRERAAVAVERRLLARRLLPAADRDVDERWADLDRAALPAGALGGDQLRAAAAERLEHQVTDARVLLDRADEQLDGLRHRMLVADDALLALPVDGPHARVLVHAVVLRLVALAPAHAAGLVLEVPVDPAEHR